MKKLFSLLFVISSFTLLGCQKSSVSYKSVDNLDEYYADDKVAAAISKLSESNTFSLNLEQSYSGFYYKVIFNADNDYYYEYGCLDVNVESEQYTDTYHGLYTNKTFYSMSNDKQELLTGEEALDEFTKFTAQTRTRLLYGIMDPFWIMGDTVKEGAQLKYYVGSDKTLKITISNETNNLNGTAIIDSETLLLKKLSCKYDAKINANESVTVNNLMSSSYSCPKHKTLKDIGWKE